MQISLKELEIFELPSVTFCLEKGFKNTTSDLALLKHELAELEDIVKPYFHDYGDWKVHSVFSPYYGQCHTITGQAINASNYQVYGTARG